jgi:hypothetical protein
VSGVREPCEFYAQCPTCVRAVGLVCHCGNDKLPITTEAQEVLALRCIEVYARWLEVLELLDARGILVTGKVPPRSVAECHEAILKLGEKP